MKVKVGQTYRYVPVPMDVYDPRTTLKEGEIVKVVRPFGCPPPNTMGHCHVEKNGKLVGIVLCNSLEPVDAS